MDRFTTIREAGVDYRVRQRLDAGRIVGSETVLLGEVANPDGDGADVAPPTRWSTRSVILPAHRL